MEYVPKKKKKRGRPKGTKNKKKTTALRWVALRRTYCTKPLSVSLYGTQAMTRHASRAKTHRPQRAPAPLPTRRETLPRRAHNPCVSTNASYLCFNRAYSFSPRATHSASPVSPSTRSLNTRQDRTILLSTNAPRQALPPVNGVDPCNTLLNGPRMHLPFLNSTASSISSRVPLLNMTVRPPSTLPAVK